MPQVVLSVSPSKIDLVGLLLRLGGMGVCVLEKKGSWSLLRDMSCHIVSRVIALTLSLTAF